MNVSLRRALARVGGFCGVFVGYHGWVSFFWGVLPRFVLEGILLVSFGKSVFFSLLLPLWVLLFFVVLNQ